MTEVLFLDMVYTFSLKSVSDDTSSDMFQVVSDVEEFREAVYQRLRVFAGEEDEPEGYCILGRCF